MFPYLQAAAALFMAGSYVYHRWLEDKLREKIGPQEITIPRVDDGASVPLVYGKVRVRSPILAWASTPARYTGDTLTNGWPDGATFYGMDMFFVIGIPFADGDCEAGVHTMWLGEKQLARWVSAAETQVQAEVIASANTEPGPVGGFALWYLGTSTQNPATGQLGTLMTADGVDLYTIPGYRGFISIVLYNSGGRFVIGASPNVPQPSFEVSTYKTDDSYPATGIYARVGEDSNPINILWDLLIRSFGKLGISTSYIDSDTFGAAASTLYQERHGMSCVFDRATELDDHILEILKQIDGVLYEDSVTGTIKIKLIRPDYDVRTIPHITKDNAKDVTNFAMSSPTDTVNRVQIVFTNRGVQDTTSEDYRKDYADDSVSDEHAADIAAQGETIEEVIRYPFCTTRSLATQLATRELAARGRTVIKCRALVDRSFIRVNPGDAVKVTWSNPDIAGIVFRVAAVDRGTLEDGLIALDLISDFFYQYRQIPPQPPDPNPFGGDGLVIGTR